MKSNRVYLPNMNGLRAIAAILVIIHHWGFGHENILDIPIIGNSIMIVGKLGVVLFFVLSGFLITYLLILEKESGKIKIKNFYIRRILRIWPLYFLIIILGMFVIPNIVILRPPGLLENISDNFYSKLILFVFFLPNAVYSFFPNISILSQTWSIGVEEQFYLFWPWLVKKTNNYKKSFFYVITIYLIIKLLLYIATLYSGNKNLSSFVIFWNHFLIDSMAIGALFAYLYHLKNRAFDFFTSQYIFFTTLALAIIFIGSSTNFLFLHYEIYSILFAVIILNLVSEKYLNYSLENRVLNYLGKISYGLYMYHLLVITILNKNFFRAYDFSPLIQLVIIVIVTIFVSAISYEMFESKFIKLKLKYTTIKSGELAKERK